MKKCNAHKCWRRFGKLVYIYKLLSMDKKLMLKKLDAPMPTKRNGILPPLLARNMLFAFFGSYFALVAPLSAFGNSNGPEAVLKGDYYVCPDGSAISQSLHNYEIFKNFLEPEIKSRLDGVKGRIFIAKQAANFSSADISAFYERFLESDVEIPSAYKFIGGAVPTQPKLDAKEYAMVFVNKAGQRVIWLVTYSNFGLLQDTEGKQFKTNSFETGSAVYCPSPGILLSKIVMRLKMEATDHYGDQQALPLVFLSVGFYFKAESPSKLNTPSF